MKAEDIIRTIKVVNVNDWNELVREVYGRPYDFQQQEACRDRGMYSLYIPNYCEDWEEGLTDIIPETVNGIQMGVTLKAWLTRDPKQQLKEQKYPLPNDLTLWWERNFYPPVEVIANDLYEKGLFPTGPYSIEIDW